MVTVAGSPFPLWVGEESSELSGLFAGIAGNPAIAPDRHQISGAHLEIAGFDLDDVGVVQLVDSGEIVNSGYFPCDDLIPPHSRSRNSSEDRHGTGGSRLLLGANDQCN
jgi:hypothetical protein